jgi:hypothetical protein
MALLKIKDFDPNYKDVFSGFDIKGLSVYSEVNNEKIGSVHDLLVDEQGHFRYFIVDLGFWGFGKQVLLPVARSRVDNEGKHVYALGLTKEQVENLPEFSERLRIDKEPDRGHDASYPQTTGSEMPPPVASSPENIPMAGQVPPPAVAQGGYPASGQPTPGQSTSYSAPPPSQPVQNQPMDQPNYPQSYPGYAPVDQPLPRSADLPPTQPPVQQQPVQYYYAQQPQQQQPPQQIPPQQGFQRSTYSASSSDVNQSYDYQQEPGMYEVSEQNHSVLRRYEQRLQEKHMSERRR